MGRCRRFCDGISLGLGGSRGLRGSPFDRGGRNEGSFVLRGFDAAVAYEGLDEIEHSEAGAVMISMHDWCYQPL